MKPSTFTRNLLPFPIDRVANRGALSQCLLMLTLALLASTVTARETPEEVVIKSYELLTDDCDATCCDVVAGLHSKNFLDMVHRARVASLEAGFEPDPSNPDRTYPEPAEIAAMTPRESFADTLCNIRDEVPVEFRFTRVEILARRDLGPDRVAIVLNLTGLEAAPDMKEERLVRLIVEDDEWRIDF